MRQDKNLAFALRRAGNSYGEISKKLNVPKSTMHYWFRDLSWSKQIKITRIKQNRVLAKKNIEIIAAAQKVRWEKWRQSYQKEAERQFSQLKNYTLFIIGIMLYWGEGDHGKKNNQVRLINTDPRMMYIFKRFLQKICLVSRDKMKVTLFIYSDLDEKTCKAFWSSYVKLPDKQFYKTQILIGRHSTKRTSYGMCALSVNSQGLKEKLLIWENLCYKEFKNNAGVA